MNQRFSIVPVFYLAFLLIPLYWLLTMSFKPMKELAGQLTLYPKSPTRITTKSFSVIRVGNWALSMQRSMS